MINSWQTRVTNANKLYGEWNSKFRCDILEEYWECFQWKGKKDFLTINYNPYTINLFYSTIKIKQASLLFQKPSFLVSPRPGNAGWDLDFAVRSAQIKQDVLNTVIQNPNVNFKNNVKLAHLDSMFRFGIIEVGYAADWRNPQKDQPLLSNWNSEEEIPIEKVRVLEDNELPINERFYFKRVNPKHFRVSVSSAFELNDLEWCGYYDYYYTDILRKTKGIKWPKDRQSQVLSADFSGNAVLADPQTRSVNPDFLKMLSQGSISRVWHIWDNIEHTRLLLLDGDMEVLWEKEFHRLPFRDLRWDLRTEGWYPIPPAFQWISPQDEINEAREQTRSFRRRFTRKFQYVANAVDEEEKEKFVSGPDGVLIKVNQADAIAPIQNPEQGPTAENALVLAKEDFNIISGTSAEARGQSADRETATAAKIIDARSQIRESSEQLDFSEWMCAIARETIAQAQESLVEGIWVKDTTGPGNDIMQEVQINQPYYKWIKAQDIDDGYDIDIDIDVINATPAAMEQQKQSFITFLSIVQNYPAVAMSPVLIREAAYRAGYRNEKVIHQMQQAAVLSLVAKGQQAAAAKGTSIAQAAAQGQNGNNAAQTQLAQQASPDVEAIQQQLSQQVQ